MWNEECCAIMTRCLSVGLSWFSQAFSSSFRIRHTVTLLQRRTSRNSSPRHTALLFRDSVATSRAVLRRIGL